MVMLKQDKANIVIDLTQLNLIVIKFLNVLFTAQISAE